MVKGKAEICHTIHILDQITIDKIAAGEVIERPASIVKELVENAIDAGSTSVKIEIKDGGISFIRITDNGCGIPQDEVQRAFLRHSTSKIETVEDLSHIASLGFRGEALSSIAAVTRTELITKTADAELGTRYVIEGGKKYPGRYRCAERNNLSRSSVILQCSCEKKIFENANDRSRTCAGSLDAPCPVSSGSCFSVFE